MLWKCYTQYASKFGKFSSGHRTGKGQFSFQSQRSTMPKNIQTTANTLISHTSKVMLKILQARLQQYASCELPGVQAGFRKGRGTRNHIANIRCITENSKRTPEKHFLLLYWLRQSLWKCRSQQTVGKVFKRWQYQATLPASWEICMQVKRQRLESDMEQQTGSKLGKGYVKIVYCHPAYFTYMQSVSCEMLGWVKHKLESRLLGKISITSETQMTPPLWWKQRTEESLDESARGEWKVWLKTQHLENKDHDIWSHHSMANRWGKNGNSDNVFGLQNHCSSWLQPWN